MDRFTSLMVARWEHSSVCPAVLCVGRTCTESGSVLQGREGQGSYSAACLLSMRSAVHMYPHARPLLNLGMSPPRLPPCFLPRVDDGRSSDAPLAILAGDDQEILKGISTCISRHHWTISLSSLFQLLTTVTISSGGLCSRTIQQVA